MVATSFVPKKAGDRVKTNRRDAVSLAKLLRAGELTAVWVPDERHEAMRDLSRARQAVKKDLQGKRQQISSLMLWLERIYPGKTTWGPAHMKWLMAQKIEHRKQRIAFEELLEGIRQESERVSRVSDQTKRRQTGRASITRSSEPPPAPPATGQSEIPLHLWTPPRKMQAVLFEKIGTQSDAAICPASDAVMELRARIGVRGAGPRNFEGARG
ncbi:IS110 family transposase [Bradyrhizobium sp. UFLA05-112]